MAEMRQAILEARIREFEAILDKGKGAADYESRWILSLVRKALAEDKLTLSQATAKTCRAPRRAR